MHSTSRSILAGLTLIALSLGLACQGESSTDDSERRAATSREASGDSPDKNSDKPAPLTERIEKSADRAIKFVRGFQDGPTGAVSVMAPVGAQTRHPGVTAMAVLAYLGAGHRGYTMEDDPMVRNAVEWLVSLQKEDGSIYERDSIGYVTSLALTALEKADSKRFAREIEKARDFLVRLQADEGDGYRVGDRFYGGVGYGSDERPDLSNTQFAIEAVHAAGLAPDHAFYKAALNYLERCQNNSETNNSVWKDAEGNEVRPGNDGGAIYFPGDSKAGVEVLPDGSRVFVSYGSMSYALLKSYLFCGLDRRDPRVRAVARWCGQNFDLDRHPGFKAGKKGNEPYQGLYYYYYTLAKSLAIYGQPTLKDASGVERDWATELAEKLLALQRDDGSFVNEKNDRWREGFAVIASLYATLALDECRDFLQAQSSK